MSDDPSQDDEPFPGREGAHPEKLRQALAPGRDLIVAGSVVSWVALVLSIIPLAGYLGLLGQALILLGQTRPPPGRRGPLPLGSVSAGSMAVFAAFAWSHFIATTFRGSCPHLYAFDGAEWRLEADALSGAFFAAAEGEDLVRLESARADQGRYRVRLINERPERDYVDLLQVLAVDHPADTEALPTPSGEVFVVRSRRAPRAAVDRHGRDVGASLAAADGASWTSPGALPNELSTATPSAAPALSATSTLSPASGPESAAAAEPVDTLEVAFDGLDDAAVSPNETWALLVRARTTERATDGLYSYLAEMGPGLGALLHLAERSHRYPYARRIADEIDRLDLPLWIDVNGAAERRRVPPIGPALLRTFVVPLQASPRAGHLHVRLSGTPGVWEVDQVALVSGGAPRDAPRPLDALRAIDTLDAIGTLDAGTPLGQRSDAAALLATADARRLELLQGAAVDLELAAPAEPPRDARTLFARLRGYYEVDIGGRRWIDPIAVWQHHTGVRSFPRWFAERTAASPTDAARANSAPRPASAPEAPASPPP